MSSNERAHQEALYPIRTVSELTGVNAITLRAWENRYGLVEPLRKDSGHRLYTQADIDLVNRVVGLLDRGMRIGQVKPFLDAEDERDDEGDASAQDGAGPDRWKRSRDAMVAAIIRFDENALDDIYSDALAHHSIEMVTARLITPLLVELGKRWESATGSVAEEHFFAFYLRNKLGARFHHRSRHARGPRLLMACLPGEYHEVGLLLCALAAHNKGYRTVVLGSDMPVEDLAEAAHKIHADAILLSGFLALPDALVKTSLPALVDAVDVPVMLGGLASAKSFDALRRAGVEPLGPDIDAGLKRLGELVPADG